MGKILLASSCLLVHLNLTIFLLCTSFYKGISIDAAILLYLTLRWMASVSQIIFGRSEKRISQMQSNVQCFDLYSSDSLEEIVGLDISYHGGIHSDTDVESSHQEERERYYERREEQRQNKNRLRRRLLMMDLSRSNGRTGANEDAKAEDFVDNTADDTTGPGMAMEESH